MFLVASDKDPAAINISKFLEEMGFKVHFVEKHPVYMDYFEETMSVPENETVVFLSKHSSAKGVRSLTVHSAGNFATNDLGGLKNFLTFTDPFLMHSILVNLASFNKGDYSVTYEATHHGPASDRKLIFVEIGSSEKEYSDPLAGKVVADAIMSSKEETGESFCGIGGPHYSEKFTRMALEKGYRFGHIASKYRINELTEDILLQMHRKTERCNGFIIDEKSFNSEQKSILKKKIEAVGLPYEFK